MFLDELERAMDQIAKHPYRYPEYEFGTRRMLMRRFPFLIVFRDSGASVDVIAVAHGRRRPGYWRDRTE
jgi:plasmid stabilization system protein ParE